MVTHELTTEDIIGRLATLRDQVDDPYLPALGPAETIRREVEGLEFYLGEFMARVQPTDADDFIDHVEAALVKYGNVQELDVDHRFLDGQILRSCSIPAGVLTVTKIHDTQHPLAIMQGVMTIWTKYGLETYAAPNILITEPGTRRIIFTHHDSKFVTFHPGQEKTVEELEARIIRKRTNRVLEEAKL